MNDASVSLPIKSVLLLSLLDMIFIVSEPLLAADSCSAIHLARFMQNSQDCMMKVCVAGRIVYFLMNLKIWRIQN